ncbi:MAG: hypothetical protein Kow0037_29100 [Calditrichia bacterium]
MNSVLINKICFNQIVVLVVLFAGVLTAQNPKWPQALRTYLAAVNEKDSLETAFHHFRFLQETESLHTTHVQAYLGSLTALKGKYADLPWSKVKWVKRGLALLDEAVELAPRDPEVRFIRGSTTWYLPFFFKRKDQSIADFKTILALLPVESDDSSRQDLSNALKFIQHHIDLTPEEQQKVTIILREFAANAE